jgi:hypothetical protein
MFASRQSLSTPTSKKDHQPSEPIASSQSIKQQEETLKKPFDPLKKSTGQSAMQLEMANRKLQGENLALRQTVKSTSFKLSILEQNLIALTKASNTETDAEKLKTSVKQVQVMIQNLN